MLSFIIIFCFKRGFKADIFKNPYEFFKSAFSDQQTFGRKIMRDSESAEREQARQLAINFGRLAVRSFDSNDPNYADLYLESRHQLRISGLTWPILFSMPDGITDVELKTIVEIQDTLNTD